MEMQEKRLFQQREKVSTREGHPIVLLVEDCLMVQKIHSNFLTSLGYCVDIASNGQQAIRLFKCQSYAAVLLDKGLPDMEGTEVCRIMRQYEKEQKLPSLPIVALTTDETSRGACLSAGCDDFATKPISQEALDRLLKHWAHSKRLRSHDKKRLPSFHSNDCINAQKEFQTCSFFLAE